MEKQLMKWNNDTQAYFGVTSDGQEIRVEGDEYAEAVQDGTPEEELNDPDVWEMCIGANQNVTYVKR